MTAPMPQPEPMTPAEVDDIADFLDAEAMRERLASGGPSVVYVHLSKTAKYLHDKAERMRKP